MRHPCTGGFAEAVRQTREQVADPALALDQVRDLVLLNEARILAAERQVKAVASNLDDETTAAWLESADRVGRFFPRFLEVINLDATPNGKPLLDALRFLKETDSRTRKAWTMAPTTSLPKCLETVVNTTDHDIDRKAYALCAATQRQQALKCREVYVPGSLCFTDPRARLQTGAEWDAAKIDVQCALSRPAEPAPAIEEAAQALHAKDQQVTSRLPDNVAVRLKSVNGVLTPLVEDPYAQPEPESLKSSPSSSTCRRCCWKPTPSHHSPMR